MKSSIWSKIIIIGFFGCDAAWMVIALLALLGCATMPKPEEHADPKPVTGYASDQSFAAPASNWPGDHWWEDINDPQLATLIKEGLAGASDMRIAEARYAKAHAATGEARAALLPSLNAGGSLTEMKSSYNSLLPSNAVPHGWKDIGQASLDASWTIDFWGKNRAALHSAEAQAKAAEAESQAARLMVSTGIAAAYADLASLYKERDAAADARMVRSKTADLMAKRQGEGLENEGAVARARSGEEQADAELAAIDEQIAIARNRIAALMGAGPDRGLAIVRPTLPMNKSFGLPSNLPAELLGRRPDVVAARFRVEAAAKGIDRAEAGFYPNVNLMALIGFQSLGLNNLLLSDSRFGVAGPAISLPLFDGGRLRAQYRGAEADYAEAVAAYDGTLTNALREVADTAASSRALTTRLERSRAAEADARKAWSIASNRYRGGLATYLDVLTAEDALIQSRRTVASLEARAFTLDIALIRSLGGGYHS
jgi:NodT family efflux transporter outer membrane factor (OMF) lipoprotein